MPVVILLGIPVAAVCIAALGLRHVSSAWIIRISDATIGLQMLLTLLVWIGIETMPGKENGRTGGTCPRFDSISGRLLMFVAYGSIAVGAVALASSFIAIRRHAATKARLLAGIFGAALVFAIWFPLVLVALCGLD